MVSAIWLRQSTSGLTLTGLKFLHRRLELRVFLLVNGRNVDFFLGLQATLHAIAACFELSRLHRRRFVRSLLAIGIFLTFARGFFGLSAPSSDLPETREAKELSALEPKVVFLCEYARFEATPEMRSYWAELSDPSLDSVNLVALLKGPDPKIRSLAIFALGRKSDPHLLAEIAPLQSDRTPSYRCPLPVDYYPVNRPETWPSAPETVGDLAQEVIHPYLEVSGYTNFSDYWAHYRDRNYSVAWFALELARAWDVFDLARPEREAIRGQIALLPAPDRQWTILCLGTISSPNQVTYPYSEDDLLHAASELSHDALIGLLEGRIQSADPALAVRTSPAHYEQYWGWLQAMQNFVLLHARDLLQSSDADLLLHLASPESEAKNSRESGYRPWWLIAAASLRPKSSTAILDEAEKRWPESPDVPLARWRVQGPASLPSILGWFYQSPPWKNRPYGPQESLALAIERARPNRSYEPLVRSILTSDRRLSIHGPAMYRFVSLARDWHANFDSLFIDWIYAQPPDAHPELMGPPRGLVVRVAGLSRKLVQDPRFLEADAQLLYDIEQSLVATLNLGRSEADRLGHLILKIDLKNPQNTSESDRTEIRKLLRQAVRDRDRKLDC
jgi:hypothetical protein